MYTANSESTLQNLQPKSRPSRILPMVISAFVLMSTIDYLWTGNWSTLPYYLIAALAFLIVGKLTILRRLSRNKPKTSARSAAAD